MAKTYWSRTTQGAWDYDGWELILAVRDESNQAKWHVRRRSDDSWHSSHVLLSDAKNAVRELLRKGVDGANGSC